MKNNAVKARNVDRVRPIVHQDSREIQPYGTIAKLPIALAESVCKASVENLNQVLADTMTLRDMYKKHHWRSSARPSINCICSMTSITRSRMSWWI